MSCKTLRECFTYDLSEMHPDISLGNSLSLCFTSSGALAVVLMRLSQYLWRKRIFWRAAPYLKRMNEILTGFECHLEAIIGKGLLLPHTQNLVIGAGVIVGNNVTLYNGVTLDALNRINLQDAASRYPMIGDDVVIYTGAKVIGPLIIGAHAIIGANSVVLDNVPESSVAVGVPARVLKNNTMGA